MEIRLLGARFPRNIRLFTATRGSVLLGGFAINETEEVAHLQYAAHAGGFALGALDRLFLHLPDEVFTGERCSTSAGSPSNRGVG